MAALAVTLYLRRLVEMAWNLGGREELAHLYLRPWAHTLGFRGHWLTKSRSYSTTLGALRGAREAWAAERRRGHGPANSDNSDDSQAVVVKDWRYVTGGYTTWGDALLAETARAQAEERRRVARMEIRSKGRAAQENEPNEAGSDKSGKEEKNGEAAADA